MQGTAALHQVAQGRIISKSSCKQELELLQVAAGAVAAAVPPRGLQGWLLALHAHPVPLPEPPHPARVPALALQAARPQRHQLELHTVPATQQGQGSSKTRAGQHGAARDTLTCKNASLIRKTKPNQRIPPSEAIKEQNMLGTCIWTRLNRE